MGGGGLRRRWQRLRLSWDLPGARAPQRRSGPIIGVLQFLLRPAIWLLARPVHRGRENLAASGPMVLVGNHTGPFDALAYGHLLHASGVAPRFVAKQSLFSIWPLGAVLRATGQIPVLRGTDRAADALAAAQAALERGEAIMLFPEGTYTRDPEGWPMRGRLGAARLALRTGAPIVPVGCHGSRELWPVGSPIPHPGPGRRVQFQIGEPFTAQLLEGESQREAEVRVSVEIMERIMRLLARMRRQEPPATMHDPDSDDFRPETGQRAVRPRRPWEGPWHVGRWREGRTQQRRGKPRAKK